MTRPTLIYWLIDTRPETIAAGWHSGYPFYCGKTIASPETRLAEHQKFARYRPGRKVAKRINACGQHVRIEVVKIVPAGEKWREQERRSIRALRFSFPDNCNTSDGGEGRSMTPSERRKHRDAILRSERCVKARENRALTKHYDKLRERTDPRVKMRKRIQKHKAKMKSSLIG